MRTRHRAALEALEIDAQAGQECGTRRALGLELRCAPALRFEPGRLAIVRARIRAARARIP